jgi:hypothetical protein
MEIDNDNVYLCICNKNNVNVIINILIHLSNARIANHLNLSID